MNCFSRIPVAILALAASGLLNASPAPAAAHSLAQFAAGYCRDGGLGARRRDECAMAIETETEQLKGGSDQRLHEARDLLLAGNFAEAESRLLSVTSPGTDTESEVSPADLALAYAALGALHAPGREVQAIGFYRKARELGGDVTDAVHLADIYSRQNKLDQAEAIFQSVLQEAETAGRKPGFWQARALLGLGDIALVRRQAVAADTHYKQALTLFTELGRRSEVAAVNASLGNLALLRGRPGEARTYLAPALAYYEEMGRKEAIAGMSLNLGTAELQTGNVKAAEEHYKRSLAMFREVNHKQGQLAAHLNLAMTALRLGNFGEAEAHNLEALKLAKEVGNAPLELAVLLNLGTMYDRQGNRAEACEWYAKAADKMTAASVPDDRNAAKKLYLQRCSGIDRQVNRLTTDQIAPVSDKTQHLPETEVIFDQAGRTVVMERM